MATPRLHLEILEARHLLSTFPGAAGVRLHFPAAAAAERSSEGIGGLSGEGSGLGAAVAPGGGIARAAQGHGEGDSPAAPAGLGSAVVTNLVTSATPVRAVPAGDVSALDESPSTSQSSGTAAPSPFGQGATTTDEETFAPAVAVDRPRDATDNTQAVAPGATVPVGPAMAMATRSPVADPGAARGTVGSSSEGPAIPAGYARASDPASSPGGRITAWPPRPASTKEGRPREEELPSSVGADLLASFSPFDRATLERAFDQLLNRFDALEAGLSHLGTTANLSPTLMATAGALAIVEVLHRSLARRREEQDREGARDADPNEDRTVYFPGLPGLPHRWSLEER
jgi:hypothetical protein